MRILVVEDDPVSRLLLVHALERLGHEVGEAADGAEALEVFRRDPYQVVISDWRMEPVDGIDLIRQLRRATTVQYTYLILLTKVAGRQNHLEAMGAGADDFLTKPFDVEQIAIRLMVAQRVVGLQQHVRQLEGLLSICAYCKKIRSDSGVWTPLETYISGHSAASFSHGICKDCYKAMIAKIEAHSARG